MFVGLQKLLRDELGWLYIITLLLMLINQRLTLGFDSTDFVLMFAAFAIAQTAKAVRDIFIRNVESNSD